MAAWLLCAVAWIGCVDHVASVEINAYGVDFVQTVVIYRDADKTIVDWRWLKTLDQIPKRHGRRYLAVWDDDGKLRTVYCNSVYYVRSKNDREMTERNDLPHHKRRLLSR